MAQSAIHGDPARCPPEERSPAMVKRKESLHPEHVDLSIVDEQSGWGVRYVSAALASVLGLAAAIMLWETYAVERAGGGLSMLAAGLAVSAMLGLAAIAIAINLVRTRRMEHSLQAARQRERIALDTLDGLDVEHCACLPTGERDRFSEGFLRLLGRSAYSMQGHGWLDAVHPEDRDAVYEFVTRRLARLETREHDFCIRDGKGNHICLHETLTPRVDAHGNLIEYICTVSNITRWVENETRLTNRVETLAHEAAAASAKYEEIKSEIARARTERDRFESDRDRFRKDAKAAQAEIEKLKADLTAAVAEAEDARNDAAVRVRVAKSEAKDRIAELKDEAKRKIAERDKEIKAAQRKAEQAAAENRKLTRAFEKLETELGRIQKETDELREQLAQQVDATREAQTEAAAAEQRAAEHQSRSERLTQENSELAEQLKESAAALASATEGVSSATKQRESATRRNGKRSSDETPPAPAPPAPPRPKQTSPAVASAAAVSRPAKYAPVIEEETAEIMSVRDMPRMPQEFLTCNLGEVVSLGGDSMRVMCTRAHRPGEVEVIFDQLGVPLLGSIEWSEKISSRKHDVGLRFLHVTPDLRQQIVRLAMEHRKIETLGSE